MNRGDYMKKASLITGQLFRLQLSSEIVSHLIDKGFISQDSQVNDMVRSLTSMFRSGIELEDFSFEFNITDLCDNKKFIA